MRRRLFSLPLFAALVTANLGAGTIAYQVIDLGGGMDRYVYTVSGFDLLPHQEIDIQFDATMFAGLTNASAPSPFNVELIQPGNPMGAPGHYSAVTDVEVDLTSSSDGPFIVDFTFTGSGSPGSQMYSINQLDTNDLDIENVVSTGSTVPLSVPVPATAGFAALAFGFVLLASRLKWTRVSQH